LDVSVGGMVGMSSAVSAWYTCEVHRLAVRSTTATAIMLLCDVVRAVTSRVVGSE
jgi:hypothetical protein